MRVVVWNVSHWQRTEDQRRAAWAAVADLGDVGLLQEVVPPPDAENVVYTAIGGSRPWGSAVAGFTANVAPITHSRGRSSKAPVALANTFPGSVAVAAVGEGANTLVLVSMYGVIDNGYADTTVNRQLTDLVPLFDNPQYEGRILLGGDLNITTQWMGKDQRYRAWEVATFRRINAFGLRDCVDQFRPDGPLDGCGCADGDDCRHVRTQYHARSQRPWQNDYVFVSTRLLARVTSTVVVDRNDLRGLSDHLPIVVDLEV